MNIVINIIFALCIMSLMYIMITMTPDLLEKEQRFDEIRIQKYLVEYQ